LRVALFIPLPPPPFFFFQTTLAWPRAFPNLYTIRGTTPRPIRSWIQSLDDMRKLEPEYMVPSHTEPVVGKEEVAKQLTDYRDGITWVYVETIRVRWLI
jgi:alkyl sulfatase BDS1-like metallo-beta-lactamase superfamily hydrolase